MISKECELAHSKYGSQGWLVCFQIRSGWYAFKSPGLLAAARAKKRRWSGWVLLPSVLQVPLQPGSQFSTVSYWLVQNTVRQLTAFLWPLLTNILHTNERLESNSQCLNSSGSVLSVGCCSQGVTRVGRSSSEAGLIKTQGQDWDSNRSSENKTSSHWLFHPHP